MNANIKNQPRDFVRAASMWRWFRKEFAVSRLIVALLLVALCFGVVFVAVPSLAGPRRAYALEDCERGAFSTEEDFMMMEGEPADGNPYISDGDLLSFNGSVCARNADLLSSFYAASAPPADLGLDAADILNVADNIVALSTELDDPAGNFTAGDLLITNGAIIPNAALVNAFGIGYDIGLDALQFVGDPESIQSFVDFAPQLSPDDWLDGRLEEELVRYQIDVWFSIEGTYPRDDLPDILDGDLLAVTGTVVFGNGDLLPASVPAGLPTRGVDFGLDAVAALRVADQEPLVQFSTEILFTGDPSFTDGDIMLRGNGPIVANETLVKPFNPAADFLGLDALTLPIESPQRDPNIQTMCGFLSVADFDGGMVLPGNPGTGLYRDNPSATWLEGRPRRPCGEYVPIDGYLPSSGATRFRVAYRPAGDPPVLPDTALGIQTRWRLFKWDGSACTLEAAPSLTTDGDGWMNTADYLDAKLGGPSTGFCSNSGLRLAVWDSNNHQGLGPADKDGHYVLWLEWEDGGGTLHKEPFEHHIQLDNTLPVINDLKVTLPDGTTPVDACGSAPQGQSIFKVFGDFEDDPAPLTDGYYWGYRLRVRGGNPPASVAYGWHNYYDGTTYVANTDETGTTPDGSTVLLREIDMTDLGASFTDCCYVLDLWVRDAAVRHSFVNNNWTNDSTGSSGWWDNAFITFAAAP
jgi:hypothetical protein